MKKINIDGIKVSFDTVDDLDNKVVIMKIPHIAMRNSEVISSIKLVMKYLKEKCNVKKSLCISSDIDFETMDTDDAIAYINDYINELYRIKEDLLEEDEDNTSEIENNSNANAQDNTIRDCSTCKNNTEYPPPHTCDICTSLDQEDDYEMWAPKEIYQNKNMRDI